MRAPRQWQDCNRFSCLNAVSRLKGIETFILAGKVVCCSQPDQFECSFPFEGNWNLPSIIREAPSPTGLNAVSRLKGIETGWQSYSHFFSCHVWMQFPVWRELKLPCSFAFASRSTAQFECSFPFEGNWNFWSAAIAASNRSSSLNAVSRLKGIETCVRCVYCTDRVRLNAVSRLKGIETHKVTAGNEIGGKFECSFPFEGNWNSRLADIRKKRFQEFECSFPFEGNWNSGISCKKPLREILVWMQFPVWRELKLTEASPRFPFASAFECSFPFEGNWNSASGASAFALAEFECSFPFEGNWNFSFLENFVEVSWSVWMQFPVWRELKLCPSRA